MDCLTETGDLQNDLTKNGKSSISNENSSEIKIEGDKKRESDKQKHEKTPKSKLDKKFNNLNTVQTIMPTVAVPEKIIICLDVCNDDDSLSLRSLKLSIELFLRLKSQINQKHEYALVTLEPSKPRWVRNFTTCRNIITTLNTIQQLPLADEEEFDLNALFQMIGECIQIPPFSENMTYSPPYIVRAIILYGRSKCVPNFASNLIDDIKSLLSPCLFTDFIWIHKDESKENNVQKIADVFSFIKENELSYYFEMEPDIIKFQNNMAKLLAHPFQRPLQKDANYMLTEVEDEQKENVE